MKKRAAVESERGIVTEMVAIELLKPHPRNYREHPDDELEHIVASIKAHGFYRPIVTAKDYTILAGHGVVLGAKKMKRKEVPVIRLELEPLSPAALKVLAGDNEIGHLAEIDDRALTEILREIRDQDVEGLLGTGFDDPMLLNYLFVTRPASEIKSMDEAAAWLGMPEYESGSQLPMLIINFQNDEDRDRLIQKIGLRIDKKTGRTWSTRWPRRDHFKSTSKKFEQGKK